MNKDPLTIRNERVKLFAAFINAIALGLLGFAVLRPLTDQPMSVNLVSAYWGAVGLAMHGLSHYILGYLRKGPDK